MNEHPTLAELIEDPQSKHTQDHLEQCLECRVRVRVLPPMECAAPHETGSMVAQLERQWGAIGKRFRDHAPSRFKAETPLRWKQNRGDAAVLVALDTSTGAKVDLGLLIETPADAAVGQLSAARTHEVASVAPVIEVLPHGNEVFFLTELRGTPLAEHDGDLAVTPQHGVRHLVLAIRRLHAVGIVHGDISLRSIRLVDEAAGTPSLILGPPCAHPGSRTATDDWRSLAECLLTMVEPDDQELTEFLESLHEVEDDGDAQVLDRLLDLCQGSHDGRQYRQIEHLGSGGTAVVQRAFDRVLGREVAYKVVREDRPKLAELLRWRADARFMARLSHPGIPQVHEIGTQPDGRPYHTMQILEQGTLEDKIRDVHRRSPSLGEPAEGGWTMRRLVQTLLAATEAVAFAHSRSIVHRDLKPANILVGEFGFVQVGDWGHAVDLEEPDLPGTVAHGPLGTRYYMPPEQDRYIPVNHPPGDVFSLGASLHHVLHGAPPGGAERVLPTAEALLGDLARRCMARNPDRRPQTAADVAEALRTWLDGSMARDRARERLPEVIDVWKQIENLRTRATESRDTAREQLAQIDDYAPMEAKLEGWRLEDKATELEQHAERLRVDAVGKLHSILRDAPGLQQAEDLLTSHYRECLERADHTGDQLEIERYQDLLSRRPGLQHSSFVKGIGTVSLVTDPPGARVIAKRFVEVDRRLVLRDEQPLGSTPLEKVELPMGSWMLLVEAPGYEPMRYPVYLGRGDHWDGIPPGESEAYPVPLLRDGELAEDECYVPAGWFRCGGNTEISGGFPERRLWCDGFVMQKYAVTHIKYLTFLNHVIEQFGAQRAQSSQPRPHGKPWHQPEYMLDEEGRYQLASRSPQSVWTPSWPATAMTWRGANSYALQQQQTASHPWRLPHEFEWEKAARGADARKFPWGHRADPSFSNIQGSKTKPQPCSVTETPLDVSPFGVVGLGGNVSAWCFNAVEQAFALPSGTRVPTQGQRGVGQQDRRIALRGGTFSTETRYCRATVRQELGPERFSCLVGIRLVRTV